MRAMKYASSAPTLASGANIGAFNVGNALGAWLGGVTITAGLGYTSPIWAGAAITVLGLGVMAFAAAKAGRRADNGTTAAVPAPAGGDSPAGVEAPAAVEAPAGAR
jgi:DHA1 family inner membrane transport protein